MKPKMIPRDEIHKLMQSMPSAIRMDVAGHIAACHIRIAKLEAVAEAAKVEDAYANARQNYDARIGDLRCRSVDGHGMRGYCDCYEREYAEATKAKRKALAALEGEG